MSKICTTARENPHSGCSGVPFMNRTTGLDDTAFFICDRASSDRKRRAATIRLVVNAVGE